MAYSFFCSELLSNGLHKNIKKTTLKKNSGTIKFSQIPGDTNNIGEKNYQKNYKHSTNKIKKKTKYKHKQENQKKSHLGAHEFRHNFQDCVSPICYCCQDIETTTHFPLHCPNHHCARKTLFHMINQVSGTISRQSDSTIKKILLFGDNKQILIQRNFYWCLQSSLFH